MLSLAVKTTTQSIIIGKLSAYARKNKTKRALWEYDNIIRSLYFWIILILPFTPECSKGIKSRESYHKLRKAVSFANFGKLRFKMKMINIFGANAVAYSPIALFITMPVFYLICWLTEKQRL